jgi:hypothetical protein
VEESGYGLFDTASQHLPEVTEKIMKNFSHGTNPTQMSHYKDFYVTFFFISRFTPQKVQ